MCIAVEIVNLDLDLWTVDFLGGLPLYPTPTSLSPDTEQGGPTDKISGLRVPTAQ